MKTVLACITDQHDLILVLIAAMVCIAGSWATIRLYRRALATTAVERSAWLVLTSVVAGAAIWCTHFIAMLGYDPGVAVGFDPVLTIVSLLVAVFGAVIGFAIATSLPLRTAPLIGGAVVGLAIAVMHYTGMMAYRVQGIVTWDMSYLVASISFSVMFSALALYLTGRRHDARTEFLAAPVLAFAIVSLHFTGMAAFRVEPLLIDGAFSNPDALRALAVAVAGVALAIVGAGIASHLIDNHARAEAGEALRNMSNGLIMVAGNHTIRLFNPRVRELFALGPEQIHIGMTLEQYIRNIGSNVGWDEARVGRVVANHEDWMRRGEITRLEHHFDDGNILQVTCQPLPDSGAIITYDDVTEAREGQRQIEHMAFHDALTGLQNRRSFSEKIDSLARQSGFTMLMIDLDHFKPVNDTLGHGVGDTLLGAVARRLQDLCGPEDTLFRLGGDELAVLCAAEPDHAMALAEDILHALKRPFFVHEHAITIGASIGLATAPRGAAPERVQQMADLALYKAKETGRGGIEVYSEGMIEEAARRREIETALAEAVACGQLELYYQPLYALPEKTLKGFEALLRWHHPERGTISPAEFIPLAEETGAIIGIGAWVIEEACRQAASWPHDLYVSINVSPVQLRSADILMRFTQALERHAITPGRIEVEVTETAMVEDAARIAAALNGLRALGIRVAMDDFGTGYSSLAHLRAFELDRIKIDRSFIDASDDDATAMAVVRAITTMARDMGIATTGEGVETDSQLHNLVAIGCDTAQGYLLGKPIDAQAVQHLIGNSDSTVSVCERMTASARRAER
jgi:diguanylate cyclase (GGDEF)-like protein